MTTHFRGGVQTSQLSAPGVSTSPFATTYYVSTGGSDGNDGKSPTAAFLTINAAISATTAGRGDTIIVAPGSYTETVMAPKAHTILKAAVINYLRPSVVVLSVAADMVTIDVDGFQCYGIEFKANDNAVNNIVDVADTAAVDGLLFDGCVFNGNDKTTVIGINAADASFALTRMSLTNCTFRDLTGTMVNIGALGMGYSYIGYNRFCHDVNSGIGIALADTTAFVTGKAWIIEHNDFLPFDATGDEVGISIAGTEDATGAGMIRSNFFSYSAAATAVTIDKLGKATINNYVAAATGGGTVVTTGS